MEKKINPGAKHSMIKSERRKVRRSIKTALRAGKEI